MTETLLSTSNVLLFGREITDLKVAGAAAPAADDGGNGGAQDGNPGRGHDPSHGARKGEKHWLWKQLEKADARLARIYGFSYEGAYFDLPRPVVFLVHGAGEPAVLDSSIQGDAQTDAQLARAPQRPSVSGVAAADFGFADDIRVWSYDKADYTIRMDIETGMFEQVLLDAYFADGGHVSGMKVGGPRVSGMKVSGMKVSGMKVGGPRGRGDPTD